MSSEYKKGFFGLLGSHSRAPACTVYLPVLILEAVRRGKQENCYSLCLWWSTLAKHFYFKTVNRWLYEWFCFVISFFEIFLFGVCTEIIPNTGVNSKGKANFFSNIRESFQESLEAHYNLLRLWIICALVINCLKMSKDLLRARRLFLVN